MIILKGKGVSDGIAIGKMFFYERQTGDVEKYEIEDTAAEYERFEKARLKAIDELDVLYNKAVEEIGEDEAMIFDMHKMMLDDEDYCDSVKNIISEEKVNAEYALEQTKNTFYELFASMDDEYMRGRAADIKDVSTRVMKILTNSGSGLEAGDEPFIIGADDLMPSETVQLDKAMLLGFATMHGSSNSHTAILARMMGIPAVISLKEQLKPEYSGKDMIIDGFTGEIYIEPDERTSKLYEQKRKEYELQKEMLKQLAGMDNVTLDGRRIDVFANIGHISDAESAIVNDAGGVGLFRSEFIYLENTDYPTENQQFEVYKSIAEKMNGKKVVISTLDIGADKQADYFSIPKEENPAMGYRAIRICLDRQLVFKTQLRALFRASVYGHLAIMFPMITSVAEVRKIKQIVDEVKRELASEGCAFDENVELGIMIETPAAAMISDLLAQEVDFFSIGTNDLTQYTLAIDRQNQMLESFYDPHHPALLRMIKMVVDNAHNHGIWVGICGELGADLELTETFLAMGVDELSVRPSAIFALRKKVRETDVSKSLKAGVLNDYI